MEKEPIHEINKEDNELFKTAWKNLTDEERETVKYVHFHFSGENEHRLPNQDELEKSAKEKLSKAGVDTENLKRYMGPISQKQK